MITFSPHNNQHKVDQDLLEELLALHRPLADLLSEARSIRDNGGSYFCKHECYAHGWDDHPSFKQRMYRLVGWGCRHPDPRLHTSQAWEVVMDAILQALPPCRHCGCVNFDGNYVD